MTTLSLLVLCGLAVVLLRPLWRFVYNVSPLHPLSSYPGPALWRASRLPWTIALQRGTLHQDLLDLHARYGSVVRIAPDELSYTDARGWRDIYLPQPPSQLPFERTSLWFTPVRPTDPTSIMGADEDAHARYRRAFMPAFTDRALNSQFPLLETNVSNLISQLKRRASANEPVDLVAWLNFLAFDVSGQLSFGETFGSVDSGVAHPWVAINLSFGRGATMKAGLNMLELSDGLLGKLLPYIIPKAVREKMVYHRALAGEKVKQKLGSAANGKRADFLDALIQHNETSRQAGKDGQALSTLEMEINMGLMIFAGSETVASAVSGILTALLQNDEVFAKLKSEIRSAFTHEENITAVSVAKLPYLSATITEGLRIHPPVPYTLPRVVPKSGANVCGRPVPEGVSIFPSLPFHSPALLQTSHRSPSSSPLTTTKDPSRHKPPASLPLTNQLPLPTILQARALALSTLLLLHHIPIPAHRSILHLSNLQPLQHRPPPLHRPQVRLGRDAARAGAPAVRLRCAADNAPRPRLSHPANPPLLGEAAARCALGACVCVCVGACGGGNMNGPKKGQETSGQK